MTKDLVVTVKTPGRGVRKIAFTPEHAEEALVLRDLVLETAPDHERMTPEQRDRVAWLVKFSIALHRRQYPRRHRRSPHWAYNQLGLRIVWGQGEHDYECVFCRESVSTLSNNGRTIPRPLMDKFRLHGWSCGLRYLATLGGFS